MSNKIEFDEFLEICKDAYLKINTDVKYIDFNHSILYDLYFDSLTYITFIIQLEKKFLISFEDVTILNEDNDISFGKMAENLYQHYLSVKNNENLKI